MAKSQRVGSRETGVNYIEGIRLYRDIMRATKFFNFRNTNGELWYGYNKAT